VKREVDVTGEFITNWRLPEATGSESLESLEELSEILANAVVVLAMSLWVRNMLLGLTRRDLYDDIEMVFQSYMRKPMRHFIRRLLQLDSKL
jgi:hypothetical protein